MKHKPFLVESECNGQPYGGTRRLSFPRQAIEMPALPKPFCCHGRRCTFLMPSVVYDGDAALDAQGMASDENPAMRAAKAQKKTLAWLLHRHVPPHAGLISLKFILTVVEGMQTAQIALSSGYCFFINMLPTLVGTRDRAIERWSDRATERSSERSSERRATKRSSERSSHRAIELASNGGSDLSIDRAIE